MSSGERHIGDEGIDLDIFNGLKVLIETDPDGIIEKGNTILTGTIYKSYINFETKRGLVCVNIDVGQRYWSEGDGKNQKILKPFSLFVEPEQIIGFDGKIISSGCLIKRLEGSS